MGTNQKTIANSVDSFSTTKLEKEMRNQYVIKYAKNTQFVIGVSDKISGASVVLLDTKATPDNSFYLWDLQDDNTIALNSASARLVIDCGSLTSGSYLKLSAYNSGKVTPTQQWYYDETFYYNLNNSDFVIDNQYRGESSNNPIWLYPFNGSVAQQWLLAPYAGRRNLE